MKKINFKYLAVAALGMLSLTSCLKDDDHFVDFSGQPSMVEFLEGGHAKAKVMGFDLISTPQTSNEVLLNMASEFPSDKDVTVTLALDPTVLTAFNAAKIADDEKFVPYEELPADLYTLSTLKVTIPAGQKSVSFPFTVLDGVKVGIVKKYGLGFKIVDAGGQNISGNFGTLLAAVVIKNKYDGVYKVTGKALRAGDDVLSGAFPVQNYSLITTGPNSIVMSRVSCWADGSNVGGIGPWELTIDPATNDITVKDAANATVKNNSAGINKYDPATKTIQISANWSANPAARAWEGTFKYDKSR